MPIIATARPSPAASTRRSRATMRWRPALCAAAAGLLALVLWSRATAVPSWSDRRIPAANTEPPLVPLRSAVEARAAAVPLPAALLEPQRGVTPARPGAVPVVPAPVPPQLCTPAWNAGAPTTRCGARLTSRAAAHCKRHSAHTFDRVHHRLTALSHLPTHRRNGNGATFVSSSLGHGNILRVVAGEASELAPRVTMTFRNTGTSTWRAGRHALGTQCPQDNSVLTGSPRIALVHDVAPGEECALWWRHWWHSSAAAAALSAKTKQPSAHVQVLFLRRAQALVLQRPRGRVSRRRPPNRDRGMELANGGGWPRVVW